jgi:hypothetical protein
VGLRIVDTFDSKAGCVRDCSHSFSRWPDLRSPHLVHAAGINHAASVAFSNAKSEFNREVGTSFISVGVCK